MRFIGLALSVMLLAAPALADWPQILGPDRNGQAADTSLPDLWPQGGPRVVWTHAVGQGFAGPVVADGRVIVFHRVEAVERVESLDTQTGRIQWHADFAATYRGGINPDSGPRCVPLVHGDHVYVFGAAGDLQLRRFGNG